MFVMKYEQLLCVCVCVYCLLSGCLVSSLVVVKAKRTGRLPSLWRGEYEKKVLFRRGPESYGNAPVEIVTRNAPVARFFPFTRETMKGGGNARSLDI